MGEVTSKRIRISGLKLSLDHEIDKVDDHLLIFIIYDMAVDLVEINTS
jgi:hypothetical protein